MMTKALVVDDSRAVRLILSKIMRDLGFEVSEAANGVEALKIIESDKVGLKVVLSDWNMPEMDGLDLLRAMRRDPELASVVVIMVTTETEMNQMARALAAGASEYVMKPFTKDIIIEKLELLGVHS
jgi:two-component system chemotaxis response regulator CheY